MIINVTEDMEERKAKEAAYLKEALRLVELSVSEQHVRNTALERKAFLLITFCAAIIGYLITAEFCPLTIFGISSVWGLTGLIVLKIIPAAPLGVAIGISIGIFKPAEFIEQGSAPETVLDPYYNYDVNKFTEYYLEKSKDLFQETNNILANKTDKLKTSYRLLKWGLSLFVVFLLISQLTCILEIFAGK